MSRVFGEVFGETFGDVFGAAESGGGDVDPPAVPTGLTATPQDGRVTLNWDDNAEADLDHYEYRVDGGTPVEVSVSFANVTGLTNDTEYDFEVRAVDDADNASAYSSVVSATPVASDALPMLGGYTIRRRWPRKGIR